MDVKNCSYFNSFTVPLRLAFMSSETNTDPIHAIFKVSTQCLRNACLVYLENFSGSVVIEKVIQKIKNFFY